MMSSVNASRNVDRERQDDVRDRHAERRRRTARAGSTAGAPAARAAVRPGDDERPELVEQDRHREDDPDDERDLERDREARRPGPRTWSGRAGRPAAAAIEERPDRLGDQRSPIDRPDGDGEDRPDEPGPELGQVVDERHHRRARRAGRPGLGGSGRGQPIRQAGPANRVGVGHQVGADRATAGRFVRLVVRRARRRRRDRGRTVDAVGVGTDGSASGAGAAVGGRRRG